MIGTFHGIWQAMDWVRLTQLGRQAVIGLLAGVVSGALVGGLGGRIAMRISAVAAGEAATGMRTENGNIVGAVTLEGTAGLILFGRVFSGVLGGLLYVAVRRVLPGIGAVNGAVYGFLVLAVLGSTIIDSGNRDFALLPPAWLNVVLFAALFPLFGLVTGSLAERFDQALPVPRAARFGSGVYLFPLLALIYAIPFLGITGMSVATGVAAVVALLFGTGLAVLARRSDRQLPAETRHRPGIAAFVYPTLAGCFLMLLLPAVAGFLDADQLKERVLPLMFLSFLVSGVALRVEGWTPIRALGYVLLAAPVLVGLFLGVQSVSEILKLPLGRQSGSN